MPATVSPRASPDALLALAKQEGRGRLKVFLGAAPGVGKTFAMLTAARAAKSDGLDVVAGLVETHGRRETEALVDGLEMLPRRRIVYRNQMMHEFDLDAALSRKPALLLVDEYAHTNVPGSRHPKRWQDIAELLAAGIDVWTTLNIQHLESLNDVIQKITKVRVRETVPDTAFDTADELIMVDFPPDELLRRLAEGKIYVQDTAQRAVESFFKPQNLTALRELALRRAAERIDAALVQRMQAQAIEGPWAAGERILACVGRDADAVAIIRKAKRLADLMDAPWIAVTVERPAAQPHPRAQEADEALKLARTLGADVRTLVAEDFVAELLRVARFENVTQLVIGRSRRGLRGGLFRGSLAHELLRRADGIAIHVVTSESVAADLPRPAARLRLLSQPSGYAAAVAMVAIAVLVGKGLERVTPVPNVSLVFLVAVLVPAVYYGAAPAVGASILSFLAYNFFFIDPIYTFTVAEPYELLALVIFLGVAIITSALAGRARNQAQMAALRVRAMRRLYEFTRRLSGLASADQVAEGAVSEIYTSLDKPVILLLDAGGELEVRAAWPPEDNLDAASMSAARWTFERGEPAGSRTSTLPLVPWLFVPLRTARGVTGAIGVMVGQEELDAEVRALLDTLAEQAAAALERSFLSRDMVASQSAIEAERVRNTVLASISHDFRTPLASILGAATGLIDLGDRLRPDARTNLLGQIKWEAEHLDGMVRNLLAMTRIDSGALELRQDWLDLREIADRVVSAARRRGAGQTIGVVLPETLPLIFADAILIEQALTNIVGNAVMHTPPSSRIVISGEHASGDVRLHVTDDGPGIAADAIPRIFDKFVSAPSTDGEASGGTGLGLAIAKGIMDAHGAAISISSPPPGQPSGTRVTLDIPKFGDGSMSAHAKILVVDDEPAILRFLKPALEASDYAVLAASTVAEAIKRIASDAPDVVVLDLGLPDGDGKDVIRQVREWSDVPIIILSARDREAEKIESLDLGADDYVNKPFGVGELLARIRAAIRHRMHKHNELPLTRIGDLEIDSVRRRVTRRGADIRLTPKEFDLLSFLARHRGKVLIHRQILAAVWGAAHTSDTQYLRVYVGQLRQKIEPAPEEPTIILTEPGIGYRLADA